MRKQPEFILAPKCPNCGELTRAVKFGGWRCLKCNLHVSDEYAVSQMYKPEPPVELLHERSLYDVGVEIGALVEEKNRAYGSSFAKCAEFMRLLYPEGVKPDQYQDMLLLVRIFDKQMRIATAKDALGESPYRDIAGYGILGAAANKRSNQE